jgi:hypothetical protein
MCATCHTYLTLLELAVLILTFGGIRVMKFLIIQLSPFPITSSLLGRDFLFGNRSQTTSVTVLHYCTDLSKNILLNHFWNHVYCLVQAYILRQLI